MAGDAGERVDEGAGRDVEADIARRGVEAASMVEREGCDAELGRVEAEREMMHDRVADKRRFDDVVECDSRFCEAARR